MRQALSNGRASDPSGIFSANTCTPSLSPSECSISYTVTKSATINATYLGDGNNTGSSGIFPLTANVAQTIQITVANFGPSINVTLSGCSISPTTIPANGKPQDFTATSGCTGITAQLPSVGPNTQYLTAAGLTSFPVVGCSSSPCQSFSATIYYQVYNTYQATPGTPASWSTPGSIAVSGTSLGTASQALCSITVSTGTGQFSCSGWSDYNTPAAMGALLVPQTQAQQWATPQASFTDTSGGNKHASTYYLQVLEYFKYSTVGSTTFPTAPSLDYTSFGSAATAPLIGSASSVWLDSGSSWSVPATLQGSNAVERWDSTVSSGAADAGQTVSLQYYHQYLVNFAYSVNGGGTGYSSPTVSYLEFGAPAKGFQGWVDAGSSYNYTNPLSGSSSKERWDALQAVGLVSAAGNLNVAYYHQYAYGLSFTVSGGGTYSNPRLSYVSFGTSGSGQLNATQTTFWIDSGTKWGATTLLSSSSSTERWITKGTTSGTASAPVQGQLLYYHQYLGTLRYTILGKGGSPPVPRLNYTLYAAGSYSPLNSTASPVWMDAGSSWAVPLTLAGGQGERWMSNVTGPVSARLGLRGGRPIHAPVLCGGRREHAGGRASRDRGRVGGPRLAGRLECDLD